MSLRTCVVSISINNVKWETSLDLIYSFKIDCKIIFCNVYELEV